jgi:hypothetical protein
MRKTLLLVLLAASASCFGQSSVPLYPRVVAKVSLTGQTAAIPTTTIFTPKANGLYRISAYGAMTTPVSENAASWSVSFGWTDDAGAEGPVDLMVIQDWAAPPLAFGFCSFAPSGGFTSPGCLLVVRDVAGQPLTYSVGTYNNPGGTYELFITVEQLM